MTREEGLQCMREALAGGGEVAAHEALPDVIMCYPAPAHGAQVPAGDDAAHFTNQEPHGVPLAHELFVTARTAEVCLIYDLTRHTSHVTRHTSHVTLHTSHVTRHTSHVTRHTSLFLSPIHAVLRGADVLVPSPRNNQTKH